MGFNATVATAQRLLDGFDAALAAESAASALA